MLDASPDPLSERLPFTMEKTMKCCHYNGDQRAPWQPDTWSPLWLGHPIVPVFHIWHMQKVLDAGVAMDLRLGALCIQTWGINRPSSQRSSLMHIRQVSPFSLWTQLVYCWSLPVYRMLESLRSIGNPPPQAFFLCTVNKCLMIWMFFWVIQCLQPA